MTDNNADCNNKSCEQCKHEQWIVAWQEKEHRKQQLFDNVKANVMTWIAIGTIGYFALILFEIAKDKIKGNL